MTEIQISQWKKSIFHAISECFFLSTVYAISYLLSRDYFILSGLILMISGITAYFYFSFSEVHSFLKINALFSGVWLITIGLAQLRFMEYQSVWIPTTWLAVCLAHIVFIIANNVAHLVFPFLIQHINLIPKTVKIGSTFRLEKVMRTPEYYFWMATICTMIGIVSFVSNVIIKGYIPLFVIAENPSAYFDFYTRFQIFYVASTVTSGLSYYAAVKLNLSKIKKSILFVYIVILVFVIPILLVQRGTFINAALILIASIYLNHRRFWVLVSSFLIIFGIYLAGSSARGFSEKELNTLFPVKVSEFNNLSESDYPIEQVSIQSNISAFKLSGSGAFLYSYLTVGHDNFNFAVMNKTQNTWGLRQLAPLNVIIRSNTLRNALASVENHLILPHLNSYNLISFAYYDFGILGVIFFMFLWSFIFGIIESFYLKYNGVFSLLAYGVTLSPIMLNFFEWMANFTTWLLYGTVFLLFLLSSVQINMILDKRKLTDRFQNPKSLKNSEKSSE